MSNVFDIWITRYGLEEAKRRQDLAIKIMNWNHENGIITQK